jgi:hypothetical protein
MVNYICQKCNKIFNKKSNYVYHTQKKINSCIHDEHDIQNIENITKNCGFCDKTFTRTTNLKRHLKTCKIKNTNELSEIIISNINSDDESDFDSNSEINSDSDKSNIESVKQFKNNFKNCNNNLIISNNIKNLENKLDKIENLIIKNKPQNTIIKTQNNNTLNNTLNNQKTLNNQNVFIVNYKDEKLDLNDLDEIFKDKDPILKAVETIYCNKNKPHQQNVLITDKSRNNIYVYDSNEWNLKNKKDILMNIFGSTINKIDNIINNDNANNDNANNEKYANFYNEKKYSFSDIKNYLKHSGRLNITFINSKNMILENKMKHEQFMHIIKKMKQNNCFNCIEE